MTTVIISTTAQQTGFGTAVHKRVVHLSPAEREAVRNGELVAFNSGRKSGGSHGTTWRVCVDKGSYGIVPRVPSTEQLAVIQSAV